MYNKEIIHFIKSIYKNQSPVFLHNPIFIGNEKKYINDCIDSTYISSVGEYVNKFESMTSKYIGSKYSIAAVNGTAALHMALILSGVKQNEEVITQSLTFVATANAIKHANADPVFIDIDKTTLGLSPEKLDYWIKSNTLFKKNKLINKNTKKRIAAIVPMHTFGNPCYIDDILSIGEK